MKAEESAALTLQTGVSADVDNSDKGWTQSENMLTGYCRHCGAVALETLRRRRKEAVREPG